MDHWWWIAPGALFLAFMIGVRWGARSRRLARSVEAVTPQTRAVMAALPFASAIVHADGRVAYGNAAARDLGVVSSIGRLSASITEVAALAADAGEARDARVEVRRGLRGTEVDLFVVAVPISGGHMLVTAHDDTSAMASEAARREFAVNVSHELKTPVGALALMVEAVAEAADDPAMVREFSVRMDREVKRITALVQQTIHLSRVQASTTVVEPKDVHLDDVIADAVAAIRTLAETRSVTLHVEAEILIVRGDHELLVMAIRNLVENAVRYSRANGRVVVNAREQDGLAEVSVLDSGIGIAEEDQERVFERFFRADDARSREVGGTGLGLSIVKHVLRQHGGEASIWSEQGVGTTVTVRLSLSEGDA